MYLKKLVFALMLTSIAALSLGGPAYAQANAGSGNGDETIHGTIASIDGRTVYVRDERGFVDTVKLHDGTIINPTGLTLATGQSVEIHGRADGKVFSANEIDTPYHEDAGPPVDAPPAYDESVAPVYVAPYPYYSYYPAYALAYPAYVSLGFGFGCCFGAGYFGHGFYGPGYYGHGFYGPGYYGHGYYGRGYYGPRYYGHGYYGYGAYGRRYDGVEPYGRGSYGRSYRSDRAASGYRSTTGPASANPYAGRSGAYRSTTGAGYRSAAGRAGGNAHAGGGHR